MLFVNGIELTKEEKDHIEKLYLLFENDMHSYRLWFWRNDKTPSVTDFPEASQDKVREYLKELTIPQLTKTSRYYGMNVFHHLVMKNMIDEVEQLLEAGVDPDIRCVHNAGSPASFHYKGITALHLACLFGNLPMAELLIKHGADSTITDEKQYNCFHFLAGLPRNRTNHLQGDSFYLVNEVKEQRLEIAKLLKADINGRTNEGATPYQLFSSTFNERWDEDYMVRAAKLFLELGLDPCNGNQWGQTPLIVAIHETDFQLFELFVEDGRSINTPDKNGDTPVHHSLRSRNAMLTVLYFKGADFTKPNNKGEVPNELLTEWNHSETNALIKPRKKIADYLEILKLIKWDTYDKYPVTRKIKSDIIRKLISLIDPDDEKDVLIIKEMFNTRSDIEAVIQGMAENDFDFGMPLFENNEVIYLRDLILNNENWDITVPKLVEYGIDINESLDGKNVPIYNMVYRCLTYSGYSEATLAKAIDYFSPESITELSKDGKSALHLIAAKGENYGLMEAALDTGADVNVTAASPAPDGDTPLHTACRNSNLTMILALMSEGADDTITNSDGDTPAHCLFKYGSKKDKCIDILYELENIDIVNDSNGMTPAMVMAQEGLLTEELLEFFLEYGIDINHANDNGDTMLILAAKKASGSSMAKLLYNEGADINAANKQGDTALMYAIKNNNAEMARYLIRKGADYNVANNKKETPAGLAIKMDMSIVLQLMTDIRVIDDSTSENQELDEDEKKRAWKKDYGEEKNVFDEDGFFEDDEDKDDDEDDDDDYVIHWVPRPIKPIKVKYNEADDEDDYDEDEDDDDEEYDEEYIRHLCMDFSEECDEEDEEDEEEELARAYEADHYVPDMVFERFAALMTPLFARFNHRLSIRLIPVREETTVFDSKLGGVPYMPKDFEYPTVKEGENCGKPLRFLAQINFNNLPHLEFFPRKGILQFFAGCDGDELYGMDFDNPTSQNCWRVIYHSKITEDVTKLYSAEDMPEFEDDNYVFEGEFLLKTAKPSLMKLTSSDYRFEEALVSACNEAFGTKYERIFAPYDEKSLFHCEEALCDKVFETMQDQMNEYGSRIGGYPFFTQEDPRSENDSVKRDILLLQIDSEDEIMWGDCGVCNFFISEEDLEDKDFSNVLYNWDCG